MRRQPPFDLLRQLHGRDPLAIARRDGVALGLERGRQHAVADRPRFRHRPDRARRGLARQRRAPLTPWPCGSGSPIAGSSRAVAKGKGAPTLMAARRRPPTPERTPRATSRSSNGRSSASASAVDMPPRGRRWRRQNRRHPTRSAKPCKLGVAARTVPFTLYAAGGGKSARKMCQIKPPGDLPACGENATGGTVSRADLIWDIFLSRAAP